MVNAGWSAIMYCALRLPVLALSKMVPAADDAPSWQACYKQNACASTATRSSATASIIHQLGTRSNKLCLETGNLGDDKRSYMEFG